MSVETATEVTVDRLVEKKKRKLNARSQCPECRMGIRKGQPFVDVDGLRTHTFCASDARKIEICTRCFMVSCECAG